VTVPLSEEEQRILHEMEQKLYEHDREFADRVSHGSSRLHAPRTARWSVVVFVAGFALLLSTFRFSVVLGAFGFFIMLGGLLLFSQHVRASANGRQAAPSTSQGRAASSRGSARLGRDRRGQALSDEWSEIRRRFRSRFGHRA
jgi:hypothetical protein